MAEGGKRVNPTPDWRPACGGTEVPFRTRLGRTVLYVWNGYEHAYLDTERDIILSHDEEKAEGLR